MCNALKEEKCISIKKSDKNNRASRNNKTNKCAEKRFSSKLDFRFGNNMFCESIRQQAEVRNTLSSL